MIGGMLMTGREGRARDDRGDGAGRPAVTSGRCPAGHFQRKWTKIRPKFLESFSTR